MPEAGNLFENVPPGLPQERFEALLSGGRFRVERILSHGHASPEGFWYQQLEAEWVVVLKGAARLRFDDGRVIEMMPGACVLIAAGERHRVDWTEPQEPTVWLAIHFST